MENSYKSCFLSYNIIAKTVRGKNHYFKFKYKISSIFKFEMFIT